MDAAWSSKGNYEDFLLKKEHQQQPTFNQHGGTTVDQLDLSCMINDLLPNEQYPYQMALDDSLAELSPEDAFLIDDAISSASSRSPLTSDELTPNISSQSSPQSLSNAEEYLCNRTSLSFDIKEEEMSPGNSLVDLIGNETLDNYLLNQQSASIMPTLGTTVPADTDFPMYLQSQNTPLPDDLPGFLPKQEQVRNMQPKPQDLDINDKAKNSLLEILKDHENGNITSQQLQLAELLAKNSASDVGKVKKQPQDKKHKIKRTSSKTKKPKTEQFPNQNVVIKDNKAVYNGNVDGNLNTKATAPADGSRAYSQVVMIPQMVFTNGNPQQPVNNQTAVTAYLANSTSKSVMTAVPIKIVSANSSECEKIPINPLSKRSSDAVSSKKAEKMERKNHNEVEKRYRKSITSSLEELKDLVFGTETRSTKAGILKKAMEHIKHLRKINQRLKQENLQLKMAQKQTSLVDLVKSSTDVKAEMQNSTEDFTAAFSSEDDDLEFSEDETGTLSGEAEEPSSTPESPASIESVQGSAFSMMNKQRFFLSMFMFAFMFLGPSKLLFGSDNRGVSVDYANPHAGGRSILSVETNQEDGFKGYTKLIVNCVLYLLFFAWLLIKGEPRYPHSCKQLASFKSLLKKADREMKQGDYSTASVFIERGLQMIGRPLSFSKLDLVTSLFWHSMCHVLHQIGILPLLKYLGWLILPRRLSLNEAVHRYRASCLIAAEAYSKLLDLVLLDEEKRKDWLICAKLSMAAINMSENADNLANSELLTKAYVNTAALLRIKIGRLSYPFMYYCLGRANAALSQYSNDVPRAFSWVFSSAGRRFILSGDWSFETTENWPKYCKGPLRMIGYQHLMFQVRRCLQHIIVPASSDIKLQDIEHELSILKQCSYDGDSIAKWWYSIISPVFYIQFGMNEKAKQAWNSAYDILPESNSLACDLYDVVDCYFNVQDGIETEDLEARLQMVEDHLLRNFIFDQGKESRDELLQLLACACAEMALIVRVEHWEANNSGNLTVEQLTKFEQDLNILKELSDRSPIVMHKVKHYNKILRVMVGSNPIHLTKQLLAKRPAPQKGRDAEIEKTAVNFEEMQEAKTSLFVFKHLSEVISKCCPKGYLNHLQNIGLVLEKSGMKEMTEECKRVLVALQTTC